MIECTTAYNLLMLNHPNANIHELSNIFHSKKKELNGLVEIPIFQRVPTGVYCNDLAEYQKKLNIGVRGSLKKYLKRQVTKNLDLEPDKVNKLCDIFGVDIKNILQ